MFTNYSLDNKLHLSSCKNVSKQNAVVHMNNMAYPKMVL